MKKSRWIIISSPFLSPFRTRLYSIDYYLVEGKTKANKCELRTLIFGRNESLHYLIDLIYSESHQIKDIGRTTLENINSISEQTDSDIVLAEFDTIFSSELSKHFLILPHLNFILDITPSLDILISNMNRLRRRSIKKIQNSKYTYEYTNDIKKFDFFYDQMYVPYTLEKHSKSSLIVSKKQSLKLFHRGGLFLVKLGEDYISGILIVKMNKTVQCALLGINSSTNEEEAGQAALFGLINWFKNEGFAEMDYGRTPPFASDSLFQYKRSWGMQIRRNPELDVGIYLRNLSDGVLDFLTINPMIFLCNYDLNIFVLLDSDDIDYDAFYRRYYTSGLQKAVIIHKNYDMKIRGTLLPDNHLHQLLTLNLQYNELQNRKFYGNVILFDKNNGQNKDT